LPARCGRPRRLIFGCGDIGTRVVQPLHRRGSLTVPKSSGRLTREPRLRYPTVADG